MTSQCLDIRWNAPSRVWCVTSRCLDIRWITPSCVWYITYSVWISHETLLLVFDVLLLSVWISDESLRLVFDILLIVFGYQMKHPFSCLIYCFSVFAYDQIKHSFSCLIYNLSVFGNQMKHYFSCLIYYFLVFDNQMNRVWYITPRYLNIEWNNPCRVRRKTCQIERFCHEGTSF